MATRMPWGAPTVSAGLGLLSPFLFRGAQPSPLVASTLGRLYGLIFQISITDDFLNLALWTESDPDAKVNLAGGIVSMDGTNTFNTHGLSLTAGVARAEGYAEIKLYNPNAAAICLFGFGALVALNSANYHQVGQHTAIAARVQPNGATVCTTPITHSTWYTLRCYVLKDANGNWNREVITMEGGAEYPTETVVLDCPLASLTAFAATLFPQFQRYTSSGANLSQFKEFRWYTGYSVAGETLTFVCDAGAGKVIDTFDLTNLAPIGGWATTNVTFAWSFDDGVAAYSAEHTLAAMNAHGVQAGRHRYARLRITVNSDGATQQYAGEVNADDATLGIGDFPEVNNTYVQDTVQLVAGTLTNPTERPECLTTNILAVNQQAFTLGDTVYVNGTLEFVKAMAAANVRVRIYNDAGVLQATLFNAAYAFLATTAVTLTAINGGVMLQHVPAAADGYYVEVVITHADLPNGSLTFFSGFGVAAAGGGGGGSPQIRVVDAEQLMLR